MRGRVTLLCEEFLKPLVYEQTSFLVLVIVVLFCFFFKTLTCVTFQESKSMRLIILKK